MTTAIEEPAAPAAETTTRITGGHVHTAEEYRSLAEHLSQSVMRAGVSVRYWRGRVSLKGATVEYAGKTLTKEDGVRPPPICVLPREWQTRFRHVEDMIRRTVYRRRIQVYGFDFGGSVVDESTADVDERRTLLSSDNIVPTSAKDEIRAEIGNINRDHWRPLVAEFIEAYPGILESVRAKSDPAVWDAITKSVPAQTNLHAFFDVVFLPLPLGVRADDLTVEALQDGAGDYLVALRESVIRTTIGTLREASENLVSRIRDKGVVKAGTIEAVTQALANFRAFAGAMDATEVATQLTAAEELLKSADPTEINRSSRHGLGDIAERINEALGAVTRSVDQAASPRRNQRRVGAS